MLVDSVPRNLDGSLEFGFGSKRDIGRVKGMLRHSASLTFRVWVIERAS